MADGYVYRTAVTRLEVPEQSRRLLERTIDEWRAGCQIAVDLAWNDCYQPSIVQALAYDTIRERTALTSQHAVLATHHAAEAIEGCVDRFARGKAASKPTFTAPTIIYDARSMTLFDDGSVSLATVEDRVRARLVLPDEAGYQQQYLNDERWTLTESTLTVSDDEFHLHLGFKRPASTESTAEGGTVLGVDLGVENLAVTSTAQFFSGRQLAHRRRGFERRRGDLQRTGTRSARLTLAMVADRERCHARDVLHRISKAIVAEAVDYGCDIIALEDLSAIREDIPDAGWFHRWAFRSLSDFILYKAEMEGIVVVTVEPESTSLRCSDCGSVSESNRRTRDRFHCDDCGQQANADYNAAKNIALKHVRRGHQSSRRTGARRCALKSGTVTANGEFTPYPHRFEPEFADKSLT